MQNPTVEKKAYSTPSLEAIGSISEMTKTFRNFKQAGPGDKLFFTNNCIELKKYDWTNCEGSSA